MCMCVYMCVCMCVRVRETEKIFCMHLLGLCMCVGFFGFFVFNSLLARNNLKFDFTLKQVEDLTQ